VQSNRVAASSLSLASPQLRGGRFDDVVPLVTCLELGPEASHHSSWMLTAVLNSSPVFCPSRG